MTKFISVLPVDEGGNERKKPVDVSIRAIEAVRPTQIGGVGNFHIIETLTLKTRVTHETYIKKVKPALYPECYQ